MISKLILTNFFILLGIQMSLGQHSASFSSEYRNMMEDSVAFEIPEVCTIQATPGNLGRPGQLYERKG